MSYLSPRQKARCLVGAQPSARSFHKAFYVGRQQRRPFRLCIFTLIGEARQRVAKLFLRKIAEPTRGPTLRPGVLMLFESKCCIRRENAKAQKNSKQIVQWLHVRLFLIHQLRPEQNDVL